MCCWSMGKAKPGATSTAGVVQKVRPEAELMKSTKEWKSWVRVRVSVVVIHCVLVGGSRAKVRVRGVVGLGLGC